SDELDLDNPYVSVLLKHDGSEYLLCTLKYNAILQVNLNLRFSQGENITFYLRGKGPVHLSGYHILSDNDVQEEQTVVTVNHSGNVENDAEASEAGNNYEEQETEEQEPVGNYENEEESDDDDDEEEEDDDELLEEIDGNAIVSWEERRAKKIAKQLCAAAVVDNNEEDNEEEDVDFAIGMKLPDEEDDDENDDEVNEEEEENGLEDDDGNEDEEVEEEGSSDNDEECEEEEEEVFSPSKKAQNTTPGPSKRKMPLPGSQERKKKKKKSEQGQTAEIVELDSDVVNFEELSDSEEMNSSIGHTPMPKKKFTSSIKPNSSPLLNKRKKIQDFVKEKLLSSGAYSKQLSCGIEYEDVKIGSGPMARRGKYVHVNFVGKLESGKIFDDRSGGKPFSFRMGEKHVIRGLDRGIEGMKVGGKRRLKIPSNLGYGKAGNDKIPPDSVLYFIVELKAVS
ncbi:FK506-binding protein 4-like, partial [Stegodyphus dumicola]|uniref:FK506-binding protein 4-like n=1 Tax=Stegodyphus dumicola TaxID=202533 RepID=UPI0015AEC7C5